MEVLVALGDWAPAERAAGQIADATGVTTERARAEVAALLESGLLVSDRDQVQRDIASGVALWSKYGWRDAFGYHALSDAVERVDYSDQSGQRLDVEMMYQYRSAEEAPPVYMPNRDLETHPLPAPAKELGTELGVIFEGASKMQGGDSRLSLDQLSTILWFGFGQVGKKKLPVSGEHIIKASPSGGSRHPTEAYVLILQSGAIPVGMYHYSVQAHALEAITSNVDQDWVDSCVLGKPEWMGFNPSVVVLLSSRVEVNMFRYRDNYSYRPVHHDVGHVMETAALTAQAVGCRSFRGYSLHEKAVSGRLGNDRIMNPLLAFLLLAGREVDAIQA
ncbi:SagB family peptide dehydrogenase [Streptomyces sp. NPDC059786]|uniref:SagB family peptide dehydrogenase n=1 Tax=Streptomyces sp. NPDC059786 TaxID=3346946 RepID=UPI00365C7FF9